MDKGFIKSLLPRSVELEEDVFEVRVPRVREALILLATAQDSLLGNADAYSLFLSVLRSWYPPALYDASRNAPVHSVVKAALHMIRQGCPESKREERVDDTGFSWQDLIASYMRLYGVSLDQALSEEWPAFNHIAGNMAFVTARDMVNQWQAEGIPLIKNQRERSKAIAKTFKMAKVSMKKRKPTQEEVNQGLKDLENIAKQYGAFGAKA